MSSSLHTTVSSATAARLAASIACVGLLMSVACARSGETPTAIDGRLDLTRWDFAADGDVPLLGHWEICWNQLLEPGHACPPGWRPVPVRGIWSEDVVDSPFGGRGVATYRLRIALPPGDGRLSLLAGGPFTAHRLFIDGIERGGLGVVGRTAETTRAEVRNRVYALEPGPGEIELQVQIANFDFRGGGLRRIWFLGQAESVQRGVGLAVLREGTLFSVGVIVGLGFLVLFAFRPAERARGYFGMMALALGLRAVPASISSFGELIAPWLSWSLSVRGEYLGMALAYFAAVGYTRTKIAGVMPPRTMNALQGLALALGAIVAFAPMPLVLATLPLQWLLPMILTGLIIVGYGRSWSRGVPDAWITAVTALAYVGFIVHDIVRSARADMGAPVELFPYAMVLWLLAEATQLLQGFHRSFAQVESLSDELSEANFELQETEAAIVRFVPFDFLRTLGKDSIRDIEPGDHARSRMSVLHCGLHASGPDWEAAVPATAVETDFERLNALIGRLEPCIYHHNGFLNEYRGDGFQAFFPGGPVDAVSAAMEILAAAREPAAGIGAADGASFDVGIGIDTGWVQLGTIGSGETLVRGVVGEPVETARRIEALTRGVEDGVLISAATREGLGAECPFAYHAVEASSGQAADGPVGLFKVLAPH